MKISKKSSPRMVEGAIKAKMLSDMDMMAEHDMKKQKEMKEMPMPAMKAMGGEIEAPHGIDEIKPDKGFGKIIIMKAEGGMIDDSSSIAEAIMKRRKMAEGGMVDIESNAQEESADAMDHLNEAALKENYDEDMMSASQPMDSNEEGHSIEEDAHDRVSAIRNRMIKRRVQGSK